MLLWLEFNRDHCGYGCLYMVAWLWSKLGIHGRYTYWLLFCQLVINLSIYEKRDSLLLLRFIYVYECFVYMCLYHVDAWRPQRS